MQLHEYELIVCLLLHFSDIKTHVNVVMLHVVIIILHVQLIQRKISYIYGQKYTTNIFNKFTLNYRPTDVKKTQQEQKKLYTWTQW